jgi:hypothetical protein
MPWSGFFLLRCPRIGEPPPRASAYSFSSSTVRHSINSVTSARIFLAARGLIVPPMHYTSGALVCMMSRTALWELAAATGEITAPFAKTTLSSISATSKAHLNCCPRSPTIPISSIGVEFRRPGRDRAYSGDVAMRRDVPKKSASAEDRRLPANPCAPGPGFGDHLNGPTFALFRLGRHQRARPQG